MKKAVSIILSVLMLLSLAACKPTPEKDIVQGKSLDKMIADATKGQTGVVTGAPGETLADKMDAPKTYTKDLVDAKGKVNIHVNADVQVPDAASVSVQRVERASFTQDQVDILTKYLVRGTDLFSGYNYKMTKSEIETLIMHLKAAALENPAASGGKGGSYLDILQEQLKTAPDTAVKTPINGKLAPITDEEQGSGEELYALAQSEKGGYESFDALNAADAVNYVFYTSEKNGFSRFMKSYQSKAEVESLENEGFTTPITSQQIAAIPDIKITEEQAKQKADELISALGIDYLTLDSENKVYGGGGGIEPIQSVWFLRYARQVNNIPVTYTTYDCMKVEEQSQSTPWGYEDMTFAIDDSGIVGFSWRSPYKVTGTVTTDSNVLSFSNCMNIFDTMSLAVNAWDGFSSDSPNLTGVDIDVNRIQFGLDRVTEQNKRDSGLLVPVWDFFGTVTYISEVNGQTKKSSMDSVPVLTINAIDGSIINRSLGY